MNEDTLIAHVKKNDDGSWASPQSVSDHLCGTAVLASKYAASFESSSWAYAAGMGSDTGKLDHSTPSAKLAEEVLGKGMGQILSNCARMR